MDTKEEYKIAETTAAALLRGGILDRVRYVCENQKTIRTGRLSKLVERLEEDLQVYGIYLGNLADKLQSSRKRELKWHPIDTAPQGEEVLYYNKSTEILCVGRRVGEVIEMRHDRVDLDYFTHWSHVVTPI